MGKPDWVLWDEANRSLTLEECICLSLDAEPTEIIVPKPEPKSESVWQPSADGEKRAAPVVVGSFREQSRQEKNEQLAFIHEALLSPEGVARLATLRKHFDMRSSRLPSAEYPPYSGRYEEKRVQLIHFVNWAHAMEWTLPERLTIPSSKARTNADAVPATTSAKIEASNDVSQDESLGTKERNNLLKLVIGMAIKGYGHDPSAKKSTTAKDIVDDLAGIGISIDDDTVRKYLKEAKNTVLPAKPVKP